MKGLACEQSTLLEFSLNVFTEFDEFSDKNICHYSKSLKLSHLVLETRGFLQR